MHPSLQLEERPCGLKGSLSSMCSGDGQRLWGQAGSRHLDVRAGFAPPAVRRGSLSKLTP